MIATVWYPPENWQTGEIVVTESLPWDVGPSYGVGLGVVQGDDWQQIEQRLPIRIESSELVARLFDEDTWVRLIGVAAGNPIEEKRDFAPPSPKEPLNTDFDGRIRLLGYDLDPEKGKLRLYWQAKERIDASYTTFVQLLDPAGKVAAQVDVVPRGGGYPTNWWLPGEVVVDSINLELPAEAPEGATYRLIVGLYDPDTGARLLISGTGADFIELATVEP
jgi:hypothetical protein